MDAINWLLINGAGAGHWLWDVIVTFFGAVFAVCQAVLNPVLSTAMFIFFRRRNRVTRFITLRM